MKISQDTVKQIAANLRTHGERRVLDDGIEVYLAEDVNAAFGPNEQGKTIFQGLSFEMVGRDFHVLPNFDLVLSETVGEGDAISEEVYVIEDEVLIELTSKYLIWRSTLLASLKI